jgi:hypothetical protein
MSKGRASLKDNINTTPLPKHVSCGSLPIHQAGCNTAATAARALPREQRRSDKVSSVPPTGPSARQHSCARSCSMAEWQASHGGRRHSYSSDNTAYDESHVDEEPVLDTGRPIGSLGDFQRQRPTESPHCRSFLVKSVATPSPLSHSTVGTPTRRSLSHQGHAHCANY